MSQVSESETCEKQLAKRLFRQKHRWTLTSSSTDWSKRSQLHLDQRRAAQTAARDQDLPGCHCRVTGEGAEKWRDAGGRQVLSLSHVDSESEGCGRGERGKKDEWGLSQAEAKANRKVLK